MSDNFWTRNEPTWHRLLGFAAGFIPGGMWLLHRREINQLPPENDRYPVMLIEQIGPASHEIRWRATPVFPCVEDVIDCDTYWAKPRVMDTLNDLREKVEGLAFAWPFVAGGFFALGWFSRGWI